MSSNAIDYVPDEIRAQQVVDRIKDELGIKFDGGVADELSVERTNVANWKKRGLSSVAYEVVDRWCREKDYSLEWALNGRGPVKAQDVNAIAEPSPPYTAAPQYDLFLAIANTIDQLFKEANVKVSNDISQDKRDHLVFYCYNQHIEAGIELVDLKRVRESVELVI